MEIRANEISRRAAYFDKLAFRLGSSPPNMLLKELQQNARFVDLRTGHPIRGSNQHLLLTVAGPLPRGLEMLARMPGLSINYVEVALDVILAGHASKRRLHEQFNHDFVQPWHKSRKTVEFSAGTYRELRRQPGANFVWYCDEPDRTWEYPHCFHLEGRHQGMRAVRRIGLYNCRDLLSFDFASYWASRLRLLEIDLDRLGRFHNNRLSGQRRRLTKLHRSGAFRYNVDRATGAILFRNRGVHQNQEVRSVQQFVDRYGRGSFLIPLDVSILIPKANEVPPHIYCLCCTNDHNSDMPLISDKNITREC